MLKSLDIAVGDRVQAGAHIGTIVARSSHAALQGARSMLASATTPQEKSDAERALEVAARNLVESALTVRQGGIVVSRTASAGELLAQGDSIASIAATDQMSFIARVPQGDAGRVKAGQPARVFLTGRPAPVPGTAHAVLPADVEAAMTLPVRIDLRDGAGPPVTVGLFGTASIEVERREDAAVVPRGAIVRDDITGTTRIAVVQGGHAHWVDVVTGVADSVRVEIVSPHLGDGLQVIVSGQVGLPEGAAVTQDSGVTASGGGGGS
jgi:Cu(I)/Ag(I) efflux system membrane fusion protein